MVNSNIFQLRVFFNMIQEKLAKTKKTALATKTLEDEYEIKPTINFSEIKLSDNRKRINRYANQMSIPEQQNEQLMMEDNQNSHSTTSPNPSVVNFPISLNSLLNTMPNNQNIHLNNNSLSTANQNSFCTNTNFNNNIDLFNSNIPAALNDPNDQFSNNTLNTNNVFSGNFQPSLFLPSKKKKFNK